MIDFYSQKFVRITNLYQPQLNYGAMFANAFFIFFRNLLSSIFCLPSSVFFFLFASVLCLPSSVFSQSVGIFGSTNLGVNNTGAFGAASSVFDISSTTGGLLIPRMTTAQRDAFTIVTPPVNGLMIFNTSTGQFNFFDGGAWDVILDASSQPWSRTAPNVFLSTGTDNVGIGTTTPNAKLEVAGNIRMPNSEIIFSVNDNVRIYGSTSEFFAFYTNNFERMRIDPVGNVGIGTSAPISKLNVEGVGSSTEIFRVSNDLNATKDSTMVFTSIGNVGIGTSSPLTKLHVFGGDLNLEQNNAYRIGNEVVLDRTASRVAVGSNFVTDLILRAGSEKIRIKTDGNVGIGTTAPVSLLNTEGAGMIGEVFRVSNDKDATKDSTIVFASAGYVGIGTTTPAEMLDVTGRLRIGANAAPGVTTDKLYNVGGNIFWNGLQLNTSGSSAWSRTAPYTYLTTGTDNVGIGTSVPTDRLEIQATFPTFRLNLTDNAQYSSIRFSENGTINGAIGQWGSLYAFDANLRNDVSIINQTAGASAGDINFHLLGNLTTPSMIIKSSGNVGIGTTGPLSRLHVQGTTTSDSYLRVDGPAATLQSVFGVNEASTLGFAGTLSNHKFELRTNNIDRITILNDGNVGVGTSIPSSKLNIEGLGSAFEMFRVSNDLNGIKDSVMVITSAGNVGIGTTSPITNLHIASNTMGTSIALQIASDAGMQGGFSMLRNRGTMAAPTAVLLNDALGSFGFIGYDGAAFGATGPNAEISAKAVENFTTIAHGTEMSFRTTPIGSTTASTRMTIAASGNITIPALVGPGNVQADALGNLSVAAIPSGANAWTRSAPNLYLTNIPDSVGIGTSTPNAKLHVIKTGGTDAAIAGTTSGAGAGIYASNSETGAFIRYAVKGEISVAGAGVGQAAGIYGISNGTTGGANGVYGSSAGVTGTGVYGKATHTTGNNTGVWGETPSNATNATGVFGKQTSVTGQVYGVIGETNSADTLAAGVLGRSQAGTGIAIGVYGKTSSATGFAGYFDGGKNYFQGNMGIGTIYPSAKLNVEGAASGSELFRVSNDANATKDSLMVITSAGNVGIGTISPSYSLHILHNTNSNGLFLDRNSATIRNSEIHLAQQGISRWSIGNDFSKTNSQDFFIFDQVASATRFFINSVGKVGINTSNPGNPLSLEYSGGDAFAIGEVSGQANPKQLVLGYNTSLSIGEIQSLQNGIAYTPLILQRFGGNVGIGTTSPTNILEINGGNIGINGANGVRFLASGGGDARFTENWGIRFMSTDNPTSLHHLSTNSALFVGYVPTGATYPRGDLYVQGNVGIGTTAPGQKLTVAGTIETTSGGVKFPDASIQTTAATGGILMGKSVFTVAGAGTWTKPAGCSFVVVEAIGGGGGGGGTAASGSGTGAVGAGGGGGGYAMMRIDASTLSASESVSVGGGGAGGASGGGAGSIGGNSTFGTTIKVQANGGAGGGGTSPASTYPFANGGVGGSGITGDLLMKGQGGGIALGNNGVAIFSGFGGNAAKGGGGAAGAISGVIGSAAGISGGNYGGGGSGAWSYGISGGAQSGGSGAVGMVIIWEYK